MHIFYRNNRYSDKRNTPSPPPLKKVGGGGLRNYLSQVMHAAGFLVVYKFFIWATNKTTTYLMLSYADKEI